MQDSEKRVALVTGANKGIGFEIARQLAVKEITVLIGARDRERGVKAQEKLMSQGLDVHAILLDVADPQSIQAAVGRVKDDFKRLDILVNNAGIMIDSHTDMRELSISILQNTFDTNAFGPLLLSQACIPLMQANNYGRIVNMSSTLGSLTEIAGPNSLYAEVRSPAYRLSKTVLNGITVMLAAELRGTNILMNSACPGWVRTDLGGSQAPRSPEQGADTPVWLAMLPDGGPTGGFFRDRQPIPW
jgi:NAD(P)-dependent dehydrogenase (short-subunit alcohol dehydrogenase family)